jgi:hypothetical protein
LRTYGATNLRLTKEDIDDLLPNLNLTGINIGATDLNGQYLNLSDLGIGGLNFTVNSTDVLGNLNLTNISA